MRHSTSLFRSVIAAVAMTAMLAGCAGSQPVAPANHFTWLGKTHLGLKLEGQGSAAGGLAGVDYDPASGIWVLTGDARSSQRPARLYSAR